jgi:hypothetical protein
VNAWIDRLDSELPLLAPQRAIRGLADSASVAGRHLA